MSKKLTGDLHANWEDMSEYVVHFTKKSTNHSSYENSLSILGKRRVEARNLFGAGKNHSHSPRCVCFSEIPLHRISRLADKRGKYGIGFQKRFLVQRDGGPILYAYKDTHHAKAFMALVENATDNPNDPIWKIAPFVDLPGVYKNEYFFEWEREWRHIGNLDFQPSDAAFLIIPENLHENARSFFSDAEKDNVGPNYTCPFIDPYWEKDRIKEELKSNQESS